MYRDALAIQRQVFGNDHSNVAMSLNNLAYLLYDKDDATAGQAVPILGQDRGSAPIHGPTQQRRVQLKMSSRIK